MKCILLHGLGQVPSDWNDSIKDIDKNFEVSCPAVSPVPTITHGEYGKLTDFLKEKKHPALLAVQIAYYAGLRIGEVCGLTWQDINLDEQYLTVRRSMRYNGTRHKHHHEHLRPRHEGGEADFRKALRQGRGRSVKISLVSAGKGINRGKYIRTGHLTVEKP